MRKIFFAAFLIALIGLVNPADAQLRESDPATASQSSLLDSGARSFLLNTIFNPEHFKMSHAVEMSVGSFGGQTSSLGMYTNTLAWNFDKLSARADVSLAYSPFSSGSMNSPGSLTNKGGQVFLRNAEVMYEPRENLRFHIAFQRSPYGMYASPYGYYANPYRSSRY